ncbi:MAG: flagellin lysine-N-methylase [Oscillospiraceae bacterium]
MKLFAPDYYGSFCCLAGACRHTCCAGWEIDIDDESLEYYKNVPGPFGKRLAENISGEGGCAHFALSADERCPFLNEQGLCDIILALGPESLCQICDDHPRFRNFYSGRIEIGLGLCCEAAAELILGRGEPFRLEVISDCGEAEELLPEESGFFELREKVFRAAQDRRRPVLSRAEDILALCGARLPEKSPAQWADIYFSLERMDPEWDKYLSVLKTCGGVSMENFEHGELEIPFEQLLTYFIFRHLSPESTAETGAFAVLSFYIVRRIFCALWAQNGKSPGFGGLCEIARLYSSEIEYSDENIGKIIEIIG